MFSVDNLCQLQKKYIKKFFSSICGYLSVTTKIRFLTDNSEVQHSEIVQEQHPSVRTDTRGKVDDFSSEKV